MGELDGTILWKIGTRYIQRNYKREFLKSVLGMVVVKCEHGYGRDKTTKVQRGHSLDFHYRLKIVDDGFQWTDKSTSPWTGVTTDGKTIDKSPMVRLVSSRKKKVRTQTGKVRD